jgi:hypothetical protein
LTGKPKEVVMSIHPWTKYEIAHSRHEERVLRGLAAYEALRARQEALEDVGEQPAGRSRLLDRILQRAGKPSAASAHSAS